MASGNQEDAISSIMASNCDYVRFAFSDINGICKSHLVPHRHVKKALTDGIGDFTGHFMLSPCGDFSIEEDNSILAIGFPNGTIRADSGTFHILPWEGGSDTIGQVICDIYYPGNTLQASSPRAVAKKQLEHLEKQGFKLYSSFEYEFYLLSADTLEVHVPVPGYCSTKMEQRFQPFLRKLDKMLIKVGIDLERFQMEYGPGQIEVPLCPKYGLKAGDDAFLFRSMVKEMAYQDGYCASFMTKPMESHIGSGGHYNHSLWDINGKNLFHESGSQDGLSLMAKHWMGGLVAHADALSALCCPTVNCFRRIHTPWAPDCRNWSIDNRFSTFRAKAGGCSSTYIENRMPGSAVNPYIALAATAAAGLDGIDKKLLAPPPMEKDAPKLPSTLEEALECLKEDKIMCEALGKDFINSFCGVKQAEIEKLKNKPDAIQAERDYYLTNL